MYFNLSVVYPQIVAGSYLLFTGRLWVQDWRSPLRHIISSTEKLMLIALLAIDQLFWNYPCLTDSINRP